MANVYTGKEAASLADFLQILRLRKALIALIVSLVVITAAGVTAFLPRWYLATTKVRVEKPEGEVVWIGGYWGWDEDRQDFVWVSGVWRFAPPGYTWTPGLWEASADGYQWVSGYWSIPQDEVTYLEPPPESLDLGPTGPAPGDNYFWVPGCWYWMDARYVWRPGYWHIGYDDWL